MVRMRRRQAVAMILAAAASGCGRDIVDSDSGPPKIALVMKSLANEFFLTMENGAKAYQQAHAGQFELLANGIRNETDAAGQVRIVEQMIAAGVDAMVIAPADSRALAPTIKRAIDIGVVVVNIDNRLDPEVMAQQGVIVPFVGPDNRKGARLVGEYIGARLASGDAVGIVEGVPTTTNAQDRTAGFRDAMAAAGMDVVAVQSGNWEIEQGSTVAAAMLNAHPEIKALLCGNDNMALGAVAAVRAAGRTGQVLIGGYDNIAAIQPMLADGRVLATADQFAARQAVFGIEMALKAITQGQTQADLAPVVETPVELVVKAG